jgi:hypothetical protein
MGQCHNHAFRQSQSLSQGRAGRTACHESMILCLMAPRFLLPIDADATPRWKDELLKP